MKKIIFLHILIFIMRNIYFLIEKLVKKDTKIALFFLTEKYYYDNSKYLFEYMCNCKNYKPILFTSNKKLHTQLQSLFHNQVIYALSFKGLSTFLKTKNVIISYGTSAAPFFPYYLNEKCKNIIYLGHGTPVKRIGFQTEVWNKNCKSYQLQKYSYLTSCSDIESLMLASGFRASLNKIWITGIPRYDYLLSKNNKSEALSTQHPYLNKKIILYAPTWRDGNYTRFFPFDDFSLNKLNKLLEQNDAYLLIRGHKEAVNRKTIKNNKDIFSLNRVISAEQNTFADVSQLLPFVDILVTDYSSILVDFLLLDRPIAFIPYDLDEYKNQQGLLLNYEKNSPGSKFYSMNDFVEGIQAYLNNKDIDKDWRAEIRRLYHKHTDTDNCKRIVKEIDNLSK